MKTPPRISYLFIFIAFVLGVLIANFVLAMIHPGFTDYDPAIDAPIMPIIAAVVTWGAGIGMGVLEYRRQKRIILFGIIAHSETDRCWQCDYDLTGNISGNCPECGNRIVQEVSDADP